MTDSLGASVGSDRGDLGPCPAAGASRDAGVHHPIRPPEPAVFVQDFIDVPISGDRVLDHAARRPWLAPLARTAATREATAPADPVPGQVGYLDVGEPRPRGDAVVVPLRWDIEAVPGVVLSMSADLEVVPTGPHRTQLALCASYARPFGHSASDRALQRAAAHVVRELLQAIVATLERGAAAAGDRR